MYNYLFNKFNSMFSKIFNGKSTFELTGKMVSENSVKLKWNDVSGADGYFVYRNGQKLNSHLIKNTSFVANHQKRNYVHTYIVKAVKGKKIIGISNAKKVGLATLKTIHGDNDLGNGSSKIPISKLALILKYIGPLFSDPNYHYWCTSVIEDDDKKIHIFTSRVPTNKGAAFDPGWKKYCEIAHFVGDSPEGPFKEVGIVFSNDNLPQGKMWSPHNSKIAKIDNVYCLIFIVQTSNFVDTQKTILVTSNSLYGPWKLEGENGVIIEYKNRIVNPDIIKVGDKYHIYFKSKSGNENSVFYVAISDNLSGPYKVIEKPITTNNKTIEDLDVFKYNGKVFMLSTDNFGISGYKGAGLLWESDDGLKFDYKKVKLGFGRLSDYINIPKGSTYSYGNTKGKHERPEILLQDGKPTYFYAPSGTSVDGINVCQSYIYKIEDF